MVNTTIEAPTKRTVPEPPLNYDPLDPVVKQNPYPYYAKLRRDEPIKWLPRLEAFAIARYDDIDAVLKNGKMFTSTQFWPELMGEYDPVPEVPPMISMDPPQHTGLRRLANRAFVPSKVAALQQRAVDVANELIDDLIARYGREGECDWVWDFTALYPVTVISAVLGVPHERRVEFKQWVDDLLSASNRKGFGAERLKEIEQSKTTVRIFLEELYDERMVNPGPDLISGFIQAEINGERLTRHEVLQMSLLLLIAGVETTTHLLGTTLAELNWHRDVYARVRADHALIGPLLEEVLRYNPPVHIIFRHATADTEIQGVEIPEGSAVMPLLASGNRDESKFSNSEVFDIERRLEFPLMSFGQGPHFCLGSSLARMESKTALDIALSRFEVLEPLSRQVQWKDSYFTRGPTTLPVRFRIR